MIEKVLVHWPIRIHFHIHFHFHFHSSLHACNKYVYSLHSSVKLTHGHIDSRTGDAIVHKITQRERVDKLSFEMYQKLTVKRLLLLNCLWSYTTKR